KRGGRLSAGQRQLISFARAFLAAPAVLVLDEATSLLDIPSERQVQAALRTVLAGRTAVIIAHRLSTVAIADRVLVLDHGRITEDGGAGEGAAAGGRRANASIRRRVTVGASRALPAAAARTAAIRSARGESLSRNPLAPARSASYTYSSRSKVVSMTTLGVARSGAPR